MRARRGAGTGRMSAAQEREAWTAQIEGRAVTRESKYASKREGKYASRHEAKTAAKLWALQRAGEITDLEEQARIELIPGQVIPGHGKVQAVTYFADFAYRDRDGKRHIVDSKGFKTPMYRLKKRMALLLLGLEIEED